jgi:16S rRNA (guanine966-N2)-methyltransferase
MRIIAGLYKNRTLKTPKGLLIRPTSEKLRSSFFNIIQQIIQEAEFLDLFAGSGAIGLEALSRGAAKATFIDSSRDSIQCIKKNLSALPAQKNSDVFQGDVFLMLERMIKQGRTFDLIYADPPYDAHSFFQGFPISYSERLVKMISGSFLLKKEGMLFIEDAKHAKGLSHDFENLEFISSRQFGRSVLLQYRNKKL